MWFRTPCKVDLDDWSNNPSWDNDVRRKGERWLSTNHLLGEGYWVWLIPLSSGLTSIGVVADPRFHPMTEFNSEEKMLTWLAKYEPQLAKEINKIPAPFSDFKALKNFAHKATQTFSENRWALTGDSGIFLDPFYSPGSDMISISNTFITDLVKRDLNNELFAGRALIYNQTYRDLTDNVVKLYHDQYQTFRDPIVMSLKVAWDYSIYWGFLAFTCIQGRLCDLASLRELNQTFVKVYETNTFMQKMFSSVSETNKDVAGGMFDISQVPWIVEMNKKLVREYSREEFANELRDNLSRIERFKEVILKLLPISKSFKSLPELESAVANAPALESKNSALSEAMMA